jgi:dihydroorotate dehydrogenase
VQVYTGLVYQGPGMVRAVARALAEPVPSVGWTAAGKRA